MTEMLGKAPCMRTLQRLEQEKPVLKHHLYVPGRELPSRLFTIIVPQARALCHFLYWQAWQAKQWNDHIIGNQIRQTERTGRFSS